ncbi:MAG TPA: hypothetical protein VMA36_04385 [Candidatus Limnocylindria bacterium]|jgi:hypothetical protein|nr:hypothetical protein [Candidatus Limnocylindria bacterium]
MHPSRAMAGLCATVCCFTSALVPRAVNAIVVTSAPVRVNRCEPQPGYTYVSGFSPGYYPARPYYWGDPYGHLYHQYPFSASVQTTNPTLAIDYVNTTPKALREIEVGLVARGILVAEVRDVGTFSHGAEIKHVFGLHPNVYPLGTSITQCVPLRATYQDGTVWTSPHLPKLSPTVYE